MVKNYQMQFWKDRFLGVFWISQDAGRFFFLGGSLFQANGAA